MGIIKLDIESLKDEFPFYSNGSFQLSINIGDDRSIIKTIAELITNRIYAYKERINIRVSNESARIVETTFKKGNSLNDVTDILLELIGEL